MAGEVADGVHVHPLNTPTYLRETLLPNVQAGAARSGRRVEDLEIIVPAFLVVGDTEEERSRWREMARVQVAFYGSTPNYAFIFEQLDREDTTDLIRERQRAGDVAGMAAVIDDDLLENFVTEGTWDDIADTIVAKYGGIATRVVSYFTGSDVVRRSRRVRALGPARPAGAQLLLADERRWSAVGGRAAFGPAPEQRARGLRLALPGSVGFVRLLAGERRVELGEAASASASVPRPVGASVVCTSTSGSPRRNRGRPRLLGPVGALEHRRQPVLHRVDAGRGAGQSSMQVRHVLGKQGAHRLCRPVEPGRSRPTRSNSAPGRHARGPVATPGCRPSSSCPPLRNFPEVSMLSAHVRRRYRGPKAPPTAPQLAAEHAERAE